MPSDYRDPDHAVVVLLRESEQGLQALERSEAASWSPENIEGVLAGTTEALKAGAAVVGESRAIIECATRAATSIVTMHYKLKELELRTTKSLHDMQAKGETLESVILGLSSQVTALIDQVCRIDPVGCSDRQLEYREKILDGALRMNMVLSEKLSEYVRL